MVGNPLSSVRTANVAVRIILPESAGPKENWDLSAVPDIKTQIKGEVILACKWWQDVASAQTASASLSFLILDPEVVNTSYEAIDQIYQDPLGPGGASGCIREVLRNAGCGSCSVLPDTPCDFFGTIMRSLAHFLRIDTNTDWSFLIMVVNSRNEPGFGFLDDQTYTPIKAVVYESYPLIIAETGSNNFLLTYNALRVILAHEIGHVFWAMDEYVGSGAHPTDTSGYFNAVNGNFETLPDHQPCIMSGDVDLNTCFQNHTVCSYTRLQVGWRDQDANGVQDVTDPGPDPLLSSPPPSGIVHGLYPVLQGIGYVTPLPTQNTISAHDVQVNTITSASFRVDGGAWQDAGPSDGAFNGGIEQFDAPIGPCMCGQQCTIDSKVSSVTSDPQVLRTIQLSPATVQVLPGVSPRDPTNLSLSVSEGRILYSWTPPTQYAPWPDHYDVYRRVEGGDLSLYKTLPSSKISLTDDDVDNGRGYTYAIQAVFDDSSKSVISCMISATPMVVGWPNFQRDQAHLANDKSVDVPPPLGEHWRVALSNAGEQAFSGYQTPVIMEAPVPSDSRISATSASGAIACWDMNGTMQWALAPGWYPDSISSPAYHDNMVYFTHGNGLTCYRIDGQWQWDIHADQFGIGQESSPIIYRNKLYAGVWDNEGMKIVAVDLSSGEVLWKSQPAGWWIKSSPSAMDGKIYAGYGEGGIYAYDAETGDVVPGFPIQTQSMISSAQVVPLTSCDGCAVRKPLVLVVCEDYSLSAYDGETGAPKWGPVWAMGKYSSPAIVDVTIDGKNETLAIVNSSIGNYVSPFSALRGQAFK